MMTFGAPTNPNTYIIASIVALIVSILSVALRLWSRLISNNSIAWDDWTAFAATPFAIVVICLTFAAVGDNAHKPTPGPVDTEMILTFSRRFLTMNVLYDVGITLVKLSALFFYNRVFGRGITWFRVTLQVTGACCLLWMLVTIVTELFMCALVLPFPHWVLGAPSSTMKCIDTYALIIGTSITNVALDLWILVLPHFLLWKLQLAKWKKIGLLGVFVLGYSVVAISLYRMLCTVLGNSSLSNTGLTIAYVLEIPVAILSICLPAIVQLGKRWMGTGFLSMFKTEASVAARYPTQGVEASRVEEIEMQKSFMKIDDKPRRW